MPADTPTPETGRTSAAERFLAAIGKPMPPPLTTAERAQLDADNAAAEARAREIYGEADPTAA